MQKIVLIVLSFVLIIFGSVSVLACSSKAATSTTSPGTTVPAPSAVTISLTAQNIAFDKSTITVSAGASVTINFNNMDSGITHNFSLYQSGSASGTATGSIFIGQNVIGPGTATYHFTAPSTPGTYFLRCDIHPTMMTGSFIVTA